MSFVKVTAQFGSAVRTQYKKYKDTNEFTTILCFMHEEYRAPKNNYVYYQELKESQIIKDAMKKSSVKGAKKASKNGKTAICFKNESDAMKVIRLLEKDTYFILNMKGEELVEESAKIIKNQDRSAKINRLMLEII